jgi:hypothetical protein
MAAEEVRLAHAEVSFWDEMLAVARSEVERTTEVAREAQTELIGLQAEVERTTEAAQDARAEAMGVHQDKEAARWWAQKRAADRDADSALIEHADATLAMYDRAAARHEARDDAARKERWKNIVLEHGPSTIIKYAGLALEARAAMMEKEDE